MVIRETFKSATVVLCIIFQIFNSQPANPIQSLGTNKETLNPEPWKRPDRGAAKLIGGVLGSEHILGF